MSVLVSLFVAFCVLLFAFYLYRRFWVHRYFVRLGIPGPKPHWLFGNLLDLSKEEDRHLKLAEWTAKYGNVYGYFEGPSPCLIISDVDTVNNVFIKQFATFHARKLYHFQPDPDDPNELVSVFFARGDRWKRLRTIINPAFSSKKMKEMAPQMQVYQRSFMELISKKASKGLPFNIYESFQLLTIDTVGECAFGIMLNSLKTEGRNNPTLDKIKEMLENTFRLPIALIITMFLTELKPIISVYVKLGRKFKTGPSGPTAWIFSVVKRIVDQRREHRRNDLLQLMLDGEEVNNSELVTEKSATTYTNSGNIMKALTNEEIQAQVYIFLIAGYETTSNALAYCAYELAINPDKQDRLLKELLRAFGNDEKELGYDDVTAKNLPYLDAVVNETLRKYPVGLLVSNRIAMEETTLAGYHIPKGLPVQPDVWTMHYDPQIWGPVDPSKFYPERWLPDEYSIDSRRNVAFQTFGLGPRICVGMRFALLEMKLTLINLVQKYELLRSQMTEVPLAVKVSHTMTPKHGIWITLKKRQ